MGAKIPVKGDQFIIGSRRLATHACHRGSAIRTKVPGEFNHLPAVVADLFQAGMTVGAGHPIELHTAVAARADRGVFHRLQESFLLEGALILLLERAGGAQDEVDEDAREKEQHAMITARMRMKGSRVRERISRYTQKMRLNQSAATKAAPKPVRNTVNCLIKAGSMVIELSH